MKPIIKNKIPFLDSFNSPEEAFNYMAKVINSSFIEESNIDIDSDRFMIEGELFSVSVTGSGLIGSTVLNHNLGWVPRAALYAGGFYNSGGIVYFFGFDWSSATSTQITISTVIGSPGDVVNFKVFLVK